MSCHALFTFQFANLRHVKVHARARARFAHRDELAQMQLVALETAHGASTAGIRFTIMGPLKINQCNQPIVVPEMKSWSSGSLVIQLGEMFAQEGGQLSNNSRAA